MKKLDAIAFHEAGHAAIAWRERIKIKRVTIVPDAERAGALTHVSPLRGIDIEADASDRSRRRAERLIRVLLAGPIAQKIYRPSSFRRWHGGQDDQQAAELALLLEGSGERATAYLQWLGLATADELRGWWWLVEKIARALLDRREITGADVVEIAAKA